MPGQALRPSQFIYTFGVGSIMKLQEVRDLYLNLRNGGKYLEQVDPLQFRNSQFQTPLYHLFSMRVSYFEFLRMLIWANPRTFKYFRTERFPEWALCVRHGFLFELSLDDKTKCPDCVISGSTQSARREAIRFVRACPDGHLDDVDWYGIIHSFKKTCTSTVYRWDSRGGSLRRC